MRPIWFLVAFCPFLMVFLFTTGGNNSTTKGIYTKVIDAKPNFLHHHSNDFVFNFMNIPRDALPTYNFLAMKNVSDYMITRSSKAVSVLPTLDYQAIYVFVYAGNAFVQLKMCHEGYIIDGGLATKGWNLLALDFPKLIKASHCKDFSMEHNRPVLLFRGTARFSVWKSEQFCFFKPTDNSL